MTGSILFLIVLLLASLPAFLACTDCSSLANNDNLPQGGGPLLLLFGEEKFQGGQVGVPDGFVSSSFALSVGSVKCPNGYEVIVYDEPENLGSYIILSGEVPSLAPYNFSGRVKSLRFSRVIHPRLFEKRGYEGEQMVLSFGMSELPQPKIFGSLKIPVGVKVILTTISRPYFSTRDIVLTSNSDELPFNDPVTSVFVSVGQVEL